MENEIPFLSPILVVAAHPDDIESWTGGTIALMRSMGADVTYLLCTSGDKGTNDPQATSWQVTQLREEEQRKAASVLGVEQVIFLRYPDGELEESQELRGRIVRAIRQCRPRLLITSDPENPLPPYVAHRDHRIAGRVALDAAFPYARDWLHFPEQIANEGLQPHKVEEVWLMATTAPDYCIDVSDVWEQKIAARHAHASQVADPAAHAQNLRARDERLAAPFSVPVGEVFKRIRLPD